MDEVIRKWDLQQLPGYEAMEEPEQDGESTTEKAAKKPKIATFTDEDLDKGLKNKAASDYLDVLNLKYPSELREENVKEI